MRVYFLTEIVFLRSQAHFSHLLAIIVGLLMNVDLLPALAIMPSFKYLSDVFNDTEEVANKRIMYVVLGWHHSLKLCCYQ